MKNLSHFPKLAVDNVRLTEDGGLRKANIRLLAGLEAAAIDIEGSGSPKRTAKSNPSATLDALTKRAKSTQVSFKKADQAEAVPQWVRDGLTMVETTRFNTVLPGLGVAVPPSAGTSPYLMAR
jgi:hypothetical protein